MLEELLSYMKWQQLWSSNLIISSQYEGDQEVCGQVLLNRIALSIAMKMNRYKLPFIAS